MTHIDFYFDPSCPFCWITSRWLLEVSDHRDMDVTWRPFALAIKNDELGTDESEQNPHAKSHVEAHPVTRVIAAATKQGASTIDLYSAFGRAKHVDGRNYDKSLIDEVLQSAGLSADLAKAADDSSLDTFLADEIKSCTDVAGDEVGVPTIVFRADDGTKLGYFGPVLNELPDLDEALEIWDGLEKLATAKSFYELKRTRPAGGPDTQSTAGH